jgi:hypothetical protein
MFVPADCPHAFTNPGAVPARMLFLVTPAGHEQYLEGIAELLGRPGPPDQAAIVELRSRYDIEQLTSMIPDRRRAPPAHLHDMERMPRSSSSAMPF